MIYLPALVTRWAPVSRTGAAILQVIEAMVQQTVNPNKATDTHPVTLLL